jgi:chromosomal replication initiation ATPase DnaA
MFLPRKSIDLIGKNTTSWETIREVIQKSYQKGALSEKYAFHNFARRTSNNILPEEIAKEIACNPDKYPGFLVASAEARCKNIVVSKLVAVGDIAEENSWFK